MTTGAFVKKTVGTGLMLASILVGCAPADASSSPAPTSDPEGLGDLAQIWNTNSDGTWSLYAEAHMDDHSFTLTYSGTFQGPANKTRKMGVCLLRQYKDGSNQPVPCSTTADCTSAPSTLPSGGSRYCLAPDGTNYCHYRPGSQSSFCLGSPATGSAVTMPSSGTLTLMAGYDGTSTPGATFMADGCFEGCTTIPGSVSPSVDIWTSCWDSGEIGIICM